MKKRIISLLLVLAMAVAMMTGCGGNKTAAEANFDVPEVGYDGSEVTITFYHTMGANLREVLDLYIAEFNKLYPNIHIEHSCCSRNGYGMRRSMLINIFLYFSEIIQHNMFTFSALISSTI